MSDTTQAPPTAPMPDHAGPELLAEALHLIADALASRQAEDAYTRLRAIAGQFRAEAARRRVEAGKRG